MMFERFGVLPLEALFTMTTLMSQSNPFERHFMANPLFMFKTDFIFPNSPFIDLKYVKLSFAGSYMAVSLSSLKSLCIYLVKLYYLYIVSNADQISSYKEEISKH